MPPTHPNQVDRIESIDAESFSFLNELARAFRSGESNPRPSHFPVLEGVRAVLAHLQSAGRLLADDETRLTAEQVEDVRALVWLDGRRNFDAFYRLRALFPATEPAEEPQRLAPVSDCCLYKTPECFTGHPAPAEPAEEETKAETRPPLLTPNQIRDANPGKHETFIFGQQRADGTACVGCSWQTYEVLDTIHAVAEHDDAKGLVHDHAVWITKNGICPCGQPASSPVVPAPTETGPWQDISEAPKHLTLIDRVGDKWTYDGDNWVTPETAILPVLYINRKYAPFVAAKEG